ncbi:MAG TPA: aquaporin [Thermoleophilaceae bacterium]
MQERGPAAYAAEFIGTLILVFAVSMVVVGFVPPIEPSALGGAAKFQDFAVVGLVHAFVLFFLIQTLALISGAHFNPAVTVGLLAIRQIRAAEAGIYILMQLAGGVLGALLTKGLVSGAAGDPVHFGAPARGGAETLGAAMGAEAIGTFLLVWAIAGVAVNPTGLKDWSGLAIGATLGFAVMIIAPLTGGSFNPARALGPAIVGHHFGDAGDWLLTYVLAPGVGAVLAAGGYFWLFVQPGKKGVTGMEPVG